MSTFEKWMKEVDLILEGFSGLESRDLPDYNYHDCFEAGQDEEQTAYEALENADYPFEDNY